MQHCYQCAKTKATARTTTTLYMAKTKLIFSGLIFEPRPFFGVKVALFSRQIYMHTHMHICITYTHVCSYVCMNFHKLLLFYLAHVHEITLFFICWWGAESVKNESRIDDRKQNRKRKILLCCDSPSVRRYVMVWELCPLS